MSKKTKNDKKAIDKGILDQKLYYQEKIKKPKKPEDPAKPNLLKRFASILIDTIISLIVIFSASFFVNKVILPHTSYQTYKNTIVEINRNSHLFIETYGKFVRYSEMYDSTKTPEENLDAVICEFYATDSRAVSANKYQKYCDKKLASKLYVLNDSNEIVRASGVSDTMAKNYLVDEYESAITYLRSNPEYIYANNITYATQIGIYLAAATLTACIFYLTIPMATKENQTIGQMICKLVVVQDPDKTKATNKQVFVRFLFVYLINFALPICVYILTPAMMGIPILVSAGMIAITKNNGAFHDYFSHTKVINKNRSNAFEILESMKQQTEEQKTNNAHYYGDQPEEGIHYTDND